MINKIRYEKKYLRYCYQLAKSDEMKKLFEPHLKSGWSKLCPCFN